MQVRRLDLRGAAQERHLPVHYPSTTPGCAAMKAWRSLDLAEAAAEHQGLWNDCV